MTTLATLPIHGSLNTSAAMPVAEYLYNARLQLTRFVEYGISLQDLNAGRVSPPPEGARIDIAFEGVIRGNKLNGSMRGVDYLTVRADGRFDLCIHAEIITNDGEKIALFADGIAMPEASGTNIIQIRENVQLTTHSRQYTWVNRLQIWITGNADMSVGQLNLHAYAA